MAVTDYKFAGTAASVDRDGEDEWTNPDYAKADDTNWATCRIVNKNHYTDWLRLTNFGFGLGDIPEGSTIVGIEVKILHNTDSFDNTLDSALYLRKTLGQVGENKASAVKWASSPELFTYGTSDDDWNAGLSDNDIRNADFGIDLSVFSDAYNSEIVHIDYIAIRIYYTTEISGWAGGDVSGVAIAGIAKINGIALADIVKVNGVA